ncbi:MAG: hypothetical protein ACLGI8_08185 [Acidimicrobiia bacterium]
MSSTLRARVRLAHIGIAAFTTGVAYSPAFDAATVRDLLRFAVLPALALTGAALWALPTLRRHLQRGKAHLRAGPVATEPPRPAPPGGRPRSTPTARR